jgi:hypothetical protein
VTQNPLNYLMRQIIPPNVMNNGKSNRKRGVLLTARGWEKLYKAIERVQAPENHGIWYTFEELSDALTRRFANALD